MIINKCSAHCDKNFIKLVFDNVLILLDCKEYIIKLFIYEYDYYIFKEIEYVKVLNIYINYLAIRKLNNGFMEHDDVYISHTNHNNGFILSYKNYDLIKLDKKDVNYCYFFESIDERENILAPFNEKINNVTINYILYQKLLDNLNINEILLDLLDSVGITINKFKFID